MGRSPELNRTYNHFLNSLEKQKYNKYSVAFGHLNFDQGTDENIKSFIKKRGSEFEKKFRVIKNYSEPYDKSPFFLKYDLVKEYCKEGELVVELDATDELVGVHALGVINTVFQANPDLWFLVANSLYEDPEESEANRILPSSPQTFKHPWELFHLDKVKVFRKEYFENVVSRMAPMAFESLAYLRLLQQSGPHFSFLNEFLSFDRRTDVYSPLSGEEKS